MKIEFETNGMSVKDGVSVIALIIALHGIETMTAEIEALFGGGLTVTGEPIDHRIGDDANDRFTPPPPPPAAEAFADPTAAVAPTAGAGETEALAAAPAPPAPAAPPVSGVELDTAGLPWDARIHAATKGKNNDGKWKGKKGATPQLIQSVKAELLAALAANPAPAPAAPIPPAAAPSAAAPPPPSDPATAVPPAAPPPLAPPAAAAPPVPAAAGTEPAAIPPAVEFARVMRKVTELQTAGRLTVDSTNAALTACGIAGLTDLLVRPDLIPTFETTVDALTTAAA